MPLNTKSGDIYLDVSRRLVRGLTPLHVYGYNGDVDASAETVWNAGSTYTFPAAALSSVTIVSGNSEDDTDKGGGTPGTGAWTAEIYGLDANWAYQEETVSLDGTTPVASTKSWMRIFGCEILTVGTGLTNAGNLTIADSGTTYAYVAAGLGESQGAIYTVPAGYNLHIRRVIASSSNTDTGIFVRYRPYGYGFRTEFQFTLTSSFISIDLDPPHSFGPQTDLEIRASSATANDIVTGQFFGILEDIS